MVNKMALLSFCLLAFVAQSRANHVLPPEGKPYKKLEYSTDFVDQYYFNRLPIAPSCSTDLDVVRNPKSAQIEEVEARIAALINFSEIRSYRQIPSAKYPLYHSAFLLNLSISEYKKVLDAENLALQNFLSIRKDLSVNLIGLNQNEKDYFNSMKQFFEASRGQMIKKQNRIQSLKDLTI